MIAIGFLKSSFTYGSKVRTEVDTVLANRPPHPIGDDGQPIQGWVWTPVDAFNAAIQYLRVNYAPSDATDVASFRQMIAELTDNAEGGFNQYAEKFNIYHSALVRAHQEPDAQTCTAWVLKGIQNPQVRSAVISTLFANLRPPDHEPTFREIFTFVENYIKRMGDEGDPYKAIKVGPNGPTRVSANAAQVDSSSSDVKRCTKCWRKGHGWQECHAGACSVCGKKFQGEEYCTNWQSHSDPGTRWVPPKFRSNDDSKKRTGSDLKRKIPPNNGEEKNPEILEKLKVLRATRNELKRMRKEKKEA